jgi:hypothetical protein
LEVAQNNWEGGKFVTVSHIPMCAAGIRLTLDFHIESADKKEKPLGKISL